MKKGNIFGCPCYAFQNEPEAEEFVTSIIKEHGGYSVAINAEKVIRFEKDSSLRSIILNSNLPIPDGIGAVWGLRSLNHLKSIKLDLPGLGFKIAKKENLPIFLLGASEESNLKAYEVLKRDYCLNIVGRSNGFFENIESVFQQLKNSSPKLVFIAMGSPKQELMASQLVKEFPNIFFIGCGGRFDILSGKVKRAPRLWQRLNLEWAYRLLKNPKRARRQISIPKFAFKLIRENARKRLS